MGCRVWARILFERVRGCKPDCKRAPGSWSGRPSFLPVPAADESKRDTGGNVGAEATAKKHRAPKSARAPGGAGRKRQAGRGGGGGGEPTGGAGGEGAGLEDGVEADREAGKAGGEGEGRSGGRPQGRRRGVANSVAPARSRPPSPSCPPARPPSLPVPPISPSAARLRSPGKLESVY